MTYLIVNLATKERGVFQTARDVAAYMWGRDYTHFALYVRRAWPSGDLKRGLEGMG